MDTVLLVNLILLSLTILLDGYLIFFVLVSLFRRPKEAPACEMTKRYAVLICARNEQAVIARLLDSIHRQTYPQTLLSVFVMADNCTDRTAEIAGAHGALVYERSDSRQVGKGYALDALFSHLEKDHPDGFDGYFVIDADSVLAEDFVERMNEGFCSGHEIVCGYHNAVNMGESLYSMGQSVMFLVQNRFLNYPRSLLGLGAYFSGTGILIGASVIREERGWPYHMITEDIQFVMAQLLKGRRAYYCHKAVTFDERLVGYRESRGQLTRWTQGFEQVVFSYGPALVKRIFTQRDFSSYDLLVSYFPVGMFMGLSWAVSLVGGVLAGLVSGSFAGVQWPILWSLAVPFLILLTMGALTILCEWKRIQMPCMKKILAAFAYPVYMIMLVEISFASPFRPRQWRETSRNMKRTR